MRARKLAWILLAASVVGAVCLLLLAGRDALGPKAAQAAPPEEAVKELVKEEEKEVRVVPAANLHHLRHQAAKIEHKAAKIEAQAEKLAAKAEAEKKKAEETSEEGEREALLEEAERLEEQAEKLEGVAEGLQEKAEELEEKAETIEEELEIMVINRADVQRQVAEALRNSGLADAEVEETLGDLKDLRIKIRRGRHHRHDDGTEFVLMGESGTVEEDEVVSEAAVIGGSLTVLGRVTGDAAAVGGTLHLGPKAVVEGEASAIGGALSMEPGAIVQGDVVSVGGTIDVPEGALVKGNQVSVAGPALGGLIRGLVGLSRAGDFDVGPPVFVTGVLATLIQMLTLLVVGLLLIGFIPERVERVAALMTEKPGHCALAGLILMVGFAPLCVLLAISLLGIPLIPIAVLVLVAVLVMGMTAFATFLGHKIPLFQGRKSQIGAMALGVAVIALVHVIPIVGVIVVTLVSFATGGATLLSRFGSPGPGSALVPSTDGDAEFT